MDLMIDSLVKALDKISSFSYRGEGSLYSWISKITVNTALKKIRKSRIVAASLSLLSPDKIPEPEHPLSFETIHSIPVKAGASLRIPLSDKLFITTGLDWSQYSSSSSNPYFKSRQKVQYLGIPLKLNLSIARNERLDVYLGAGGAAEFCTSAKIDGKDISRDGPGFSFLGIAGVQFNLTDSFSLYLEPELSWTVPSGKAVLSTYRSEHPTMFSIASGVRITLH